LKPNKGVLAMWINQNGDPLEYDTYRKILQATIMELLNDKTKKIGALAFRRIIPTVCFENEIKLKGESVKDFRDKYASLINTSTTVLEQHYMRGQTLQQQEKVIEAVEKGILDTPKTKAFKRRIVGESGRKSKRQRGKEEESSEEEYSDEEVEELEEVYKELRETKKELRRLQNILDHHNLPY
jgi:hypothetical protein